MQTVTARAQGIVSQANKWREGEGKRENPRLEQLPGKTHCALW